MPEQWQINALNPDFGGYGQFWPTPDPRVPNPVPFGLGSYGGTPPGITPDQVDIIDLVGNNDWGVTYPGGRWERSSEGTVRDPSAVRYLQNIGYYPSPYTNATPPKPTPQIQYPPGYVSPQQAEANQKYQDALAQIANPTPPTEAQIAQTAMNANPNPWGMPDRMAGSGPLALSLYSGPLGSASAGASAPTSPSPAPVPAPAPYVTPQAARERDPLGSLYDAFQRSLKQATIPAHFSTTWGG